MTTAVGERDTAGLLDELQRALEGAGAAVEQKNSEKSTRKEARRHG